VRLINGRTAHEELGRRTVDIVMTLRHWRRRYLGDVLRAQRNDLRKQELCPHAVHQLMELAGYFPPIMLKVQRDARDTMCGIANLRRRARGERNALAWRAQDLALRPEYGDADDDTDEEYDAETGELVADVDKNLHVLTAEDKAGKAEKAEREQRATTAAVHTTIVASAGMPTWLVLHDGGYTPAETASDRALRKRRWDKAVAAGKAPDQRDKPCLGTLAPAKARWGYWARYYDVALGLAEADPWPHAASPMIFQDNSFGPVQLDDEADDSTAAVWNSPTAWASSRRSRKYSFA
jgi:hypothetical protein